MYKIELFVKDAQYLLNQEDLAAEIDMSQSWVSYQIRANTVAKVEMRVRCKDDLKAINDAIELCRKMDIVLAKGREAAERAEIEHIKKEKKDRAKRGESLKGRHKSRDRK